MFSLRSLGRLGMTMHNIRKTRSDDRVFSFALLAAAVLVLFAAATGAGIVAARPKKSPIFRGPRGIQWISGK